MERPRHRRRRVYHARGKVLGGAGTDGVQFEGDPKVLATITGLTDRPDPAFPIVTL